MILDVSLRFSSFIHHDLRCLVALFEFRTGHLQFQF